MTGAGQRHVYCIGTLDTKEADVRYLAESISSALSQFLPSSETVEVVTVDVSTKSSGKTKGDVTREDVLSHHPDSSKRSDPSERAESVSVLSDALTGFLSHCHAQGSLAGAIGIGGSSGTSLIAPALRALPLGVPKVIISTVASGSTTPYIETSDLILIPSVVDVAGLNSVSRRVIANGAAALAGMVASKNSSEELVSGNDSDSANPSVGLTMFGVTTPCATAVQNELTENGFETMVFHATGRGGQAMENFVGQGLIKGVIDITTTEVADFIVGGTMACTDLRFEETLKQGVPLVLSLGALDMVNFGPRDTLPPQFASRNIYIHNDQVTLIRTTKEENEKFAQFIAQRLNKSTGPVRILLPEKGISALDAEGMPYYDPDIRSSLFHTLEQSIEKTPERQVTRLPHHINDPEFASALVAAFLEIMPQRPGGDKTTKVPVARDDGTATPKRPKIQHLPLANSGTKKKYQAALDRLWDQIEAGVPIIGAGAGTGISAKFEEKGGIDLIVIYNSGRFRMAGRGSLSGLLPFKDANAVVLEMANEILPVIKDVPVLVGVCATDPFRHMGTFLRELEGIGFCGVQNFPTVGLFDGNFRQNLEETGMGFGLEVEMIRQAHTMGFLTTPYAFNESEARAMAEAGADVIVAHMGLTTSGSIGATSGKTLDQSVELVQAIADAALHVNPHVIILCHGGPIANPEDAEFVLKRTRGVHGFYGASSVERLPVELAITDQVKRFKAMKLTE